MVEFYLLTVPRFPSPKKEHKFYFGKNRTHDFRTSRCAGYLLDHSGDDYLVYIREYPDFGDTSHLPSSVVRCDEGVNIFSGYVYSSVRKVRLGLRTCPRRIVFSTSLTNNLMLAEITRHRTGTCDYTHTDVLFQKISCPSSQNVYVLPNWGVV